MAFFADHLLTYPPCLSPSTYDVISSRPLTDDHTVTGVQKLTEKPLCSLVRFVAVSMACYLDLTLIVKFEAQLFGVRINGR